MKNTPLETDPREMRKAMRPMTEAEIADMQHRQAPLMLNDTDRIRGQAGMQNFFTTYENTAHFIPEPQKPTFWQRMKRLLELDALAKKWIGDKLKRKP